MSASKTAHRSGAKRSGSKPSGKGKPGNRSGAAKAKGAPGARVTTAPVKAPAPSSSAPATPPTAPVPVPAAPSPASAPTSPASPPTSAAAPPSRQTLGKRSGPRATRVVVRRFDPRSVLRVSALFYGSLSVALLVAAALLWAGANVVGLVGNIEAFMDEVGFTDFQLRTGQFLKASLITAFVFTAAGSLANLLMAVLYNLISGTVGGINVVLGEDHPEPKA